MIGAPLRLFGLLPQACRISCESAWPKTHRRRAMWTQPTGSQAFHRQLENAYARGSELAADVVQSSRPIAWAKMAAVLVTARLPAV
jgi:hypothetical protein